MPGAGSSGKNLHALYYSFYVDMFYKSVHYFLHQAWRALDCKN
jgi:hypothetical protein